MKTTTKLKHCFYCGSVIDLTADQYIKIDTLQSVLGNKPRAYVHEACADEADVESKRDRAFDDYLDAQADMAYVDEFDVYAGAESR